jgi:hypothetical protein
METIDIFFIYININLYIDKIACEKQTLILENENAVLKKERVLQIIQSKKIKTTHTKYKFLDLLQYAVDLEPQHIQDYAKSENIEENSKPFLKHIPVIEDITIPQSIFIFHGINALFFIFKEEPLEIIAKAKSILRTEQEPERSTHKHTKKVKLILKQGKTKRANP